MLSFIPQSLLICYFFFAISGGKADLTAENSVRHPLHLSSTELNYNPADKTIEVSCRIFTDDFEDVLSKKFRVKSDLSSAVKHKAMDELVRKYITERIHLSANGKQLNLTYLGFENDKEAVIIYLESEKTVNVKKLETTSTLLYDLFDDQTNIFHITFNGDRKSAKLTYPDQKLVSEF